MQIIQAGHSLKGSPSFPASSPTSNSYGSNAPKPAGSDHSHGGSVGHQATTSQDQGKGKRRRIRTEHQQEANKLAQKRYRERKKQKAAVLESTVEELAGRAEELARIKATNAGLQNTKAQLESELLEKEAHIRRLNEELQGSRLAGQRGASDANDDGSNSVNTGDLKGLWHAKMDEMRNVYDFNGLRNAKLSGEGVMEEVLGTMSMLVGALPASNQSRAALSWIPVTARNGPRVAQASLGFKSIYSKLYLDGVNPSPSAGQSEHVHLYGFFFSVWYSSSECMPVVITVFPGRMFID